VGKNTFNFERKRRRDGMPAAGESLFFTLVELLVVIVIVAILAALLAGAVIKTRQKALATFCLNNQKQLWVAENFYAMTYENTGPPTYMNAPNKVSWARFLTGGTKSYPIAPAIIKIETEKPAAATILRCPSATISPDEEEMRHNFGKLYYDLADEKNDAPTAKCADFPGMPRTQWGKKFASGSSTCIFFQYYKISAPSRFLLFTDTVIARDEDWQFFRFNPHKAVVTQKNGVNTNTGIHLRHVGAANGVFADGHAAALAPDKLVALGATYMLGAKREEMIFPTAP
jgi:prepilin-type N-terminal cleavage/methylation domain-containing protein/prepilin-type processing-associated H-X9-DG protein